VKNDLYKPHAAEMLGDVTTIAAAFRDISMDALLDEPFPLSIVPEDQREQAKRDNYEPTGYYNPFITDEEWEAMQEVPF
jgi:hypothetical protein